MQVILDHVGGVRRHLAARLAEVEVVELDPGAGLVLGVFLLQVQVDVPAEPGQQ